MTQIGTPRRDRAGRLSGFVRLHGPLAGDSTAEILHALLLGLLVWTAIQGSIGLLFFVAKPGPSAAVVGFQAISYLIALAMLERGNLRSASLVYLFGVSVPATVV